MKKTILSLTLLVITPLYIYADDEGSFNIRNTIINDSFIKVIVKNRIHNDTAEASTYRVIDSKEKFLELNDSMNKSIDTNKITSKYVYTEIKNIKIDKNDLKEFKENTLDLGAHANQGKITQVVNIKNSRIETDKQINLAVTLDDDSMSSVTSITNVEYSQLMGKAIPKDNILENSKIDIDNELLPLD